MKRAIAEQAQTSGIRRHISANLATEAMGQSIQQAGIYCESAPPLCPQVDGHDVVMWCDIVGEVLQDASCVRDENPWGQVSERGHYQG